IRSAPPTVPGTPISPSIPPRLFFAQYVTIRPRSAAASTLATFPSITTSGVGLASCTTTNGSSPSITSRFDPPPRNLCGIPSRSSVFSSSGIASCLVIRNKSVLPPIPKYVNSVIEAPCSTSTPSPANAASNLESLMRILYLVHSIVQPQFRSQQHHQLVACPAHISRADGHNRVARLGLAQQKLNRILHRPVILHILVPSLTNPVCQCLAGDSRNRRFAGSIDVQ